MRRILPGPPDNNGDLLAPTHSCSVAQSLRLTIPQAVANPRFAILVIAGTVLEMLERSGMSTASAIDVILAALAALLLPAGVVVLVIARSHSAEQ